MESPSQQATAKVTDGAPKSVSAPNDAASAAVAAKSETGNAPTTPASATPTAPCVTISTKKQQEQVATTTCTPDATGVASVSTSAIQYDAVAITIPPMPSLNSPTTNVSYFHNNQQPPLPSSSSSSSQPLQNVQGTNHGGSECTEPWEVDGWIPRTPSGQQKSPDMIRNELRQYIAECKRTNTSTQTAIIQIMGVNNNSFRKFMNPDTYKDPWSAVQNSTYWAGAKLLEKVNAEIRRAGATGVVDDSKKRMFAGSTAGVRTNATKKRKGNTQSSTNITSVAATATAFTTSTAKPAKKTKAQAKLEIQNLIQRVNAIPDVSYQNGVYDSCPEIVTKIKNFLKRDGATKAILLTALGNINSNSMNRFLAGKGQDQRGNVTYKEAYVFFEKLRILEGKPKSDDRLKNETEHPTGFSITGKPKGTRFEKFLPLAPWEM